MKDGHGSQMAAKAESAIAALMTQPTLETAAKEVGVAPSTLWRWMNDADFAAKYREARRAVLDQATAALQAATVEAVASLRRNANCGTPAVEVSAARVILDMALRAQEQQELAERLAALEELAGVEGDKGRGAA